MNVAEVLTPSVMQRLNGATAEAICLPNAAYTSPDYLRDELRVLYAQDWVCVGVGAQIAGPGDVRPTTVGGQPILLVRTARGELRAFHNVCRHRGMQLVAEPQCKRSVLVCPYHAWTYTLEGELRRTPHFGGHDCDDAAGFDRAEYPLQPVRLEVWNDLLFVNLSGDAPDLAMTLAPLTERWRGYELGLLRYGGSCSFEARTNWKLAIENFVESYHLPWTHPSLNGYSKLQVHYIMMEPSYMGQGSTDYDVVRAGFPTLPIFPGLTEERQTIAEYPYLIPNTMLGIHPNHFFVFTVQPLAADLTLEEFHFYFIGDDAMRDDLAEERRKVLQAWKGINLEDIRMIEGMQVGRQSDAYRDGRFSPYHETTTHEFQRRLANRLVSAAGAQRAA